MSDNDMNSDQTTNDHGAAEPIDGGGDTASDFLGLGDKDNSGAMGGDGDGDSEDDNVLADDGAAHDLGIVGNPLLQQNL